MLVKKLNIFDLKAVKLAKITSMFGKKKYGGLGFEKARHYIGSELNSPKNYHSLDVVERNGSRDFGFVVSDDDGASLFVHLECIFGEIEKHSDILKK